LALRFTETPLRLSALRLTYASIAQFTSCGFDIRLALSSRTKETGKKNPHVTL